MRKHRATFAIVAAVAVAAPLQAQITVPTTRPPTTRAGGNITAKPPEGPLPRQASGRPDLTGLWLRRGGIGDIRQGLKPGETLGDTRPDRRCVLPDPGGEDKGVEAAERGREQPRHQAAAVDEVVDCEGRPRSVARQQVAHVVGGA